MASIPGSVRVGGFIAPSDTIDTYATHDSLYGRGGLKEVSSTEERDAIPADRRREGMIVYVGGVVQANYQLIGGIDNANWAVLEAGGGGGVTDHGALTGLADDDHTQYLNETRHDLLDHSGLTGIPTQYTDEMAQDAVGAAIAAGTQTGISVTYDDANNKIDFTVTASGAGDVTGPASAADGNIVLFDGITGKVIKNSVYSPASFAPALGADDNYVTDAEKSALHSHSNKTALDAVSGVNTGDQDLSGYSLTSHNHTGTYEPANANIQGHISSTSNPHSVTYTQVGADPSGAAAGAVSAHNSAYDHTKLHDAVTVSDSTSIDLTLTGQQISASAIFGTTSGTVAQGNHNHSGVYQPADQQLTDLAGLSYSGNAGKVVGVKATEDGFEFVTASGGGLTNPMTAAGDMIIGGTGGAPTRLAKGTDGQVLTLASGNPSWAAASGGSLLVAETVVTGSAVTSVTFSGLDGNAAGGYILVSQFVAGTTNTSFALGINGDFTFTSYVGNRIYLVGNDTSADGYIPTPSSHIANTYGGNSGSIPIAMATTYISNFNSRAAVHNMVIQNNVGSAVTSYGGYIHSGTITNITSLTIQAFNLDTTTTLTNGLTVGSSLRLYRRK